MWSEGEDLVLGHQAVADKQEAQGGVFRLGHQAPRSYSTSLPAWLWDSLAAGRCPYRLPIRAR